MHVPVQFFVSWTHDLQGSFYPIFYVFLSLVDEKFNFQSTNNHGFSEIIYQLRILV